jgi:hypothetical protein
MNGVWGFVVAVARFVYSFLVGDDLAGAIFVVASLALTGVLVAKHVNAWWLVPPVAIAVTAVNLYRRRPVPARRAS